MALCRGYVWRCKLNSLEVQCLISLEMVQENVDDATWQNVVILDLDGEFMGFHCRKAN